MLKWRLFNNKRCPGVILGYRNSLVEANVGYNFTVSRLAPSHYGIFNAGLCLSLKGKNADKTFKGFETW